MIQKNKNLLKVFGFIILSIIVSVQSSQAHPITDMIVDSISQSDYISYVEDLEDFGTRFYNTAGNIAAGDYIYNEFADFGLSVAYDPFTYSGSTYNNVVATLPGTTSPEDIYILGAHFDSTSDSPSTYAPGLMTMQAALALCWK